MTVIKKITDKNGTDVFLRTHTKAVVDDNGYTVESRLQAMQDEINQAQLEVGAVPSDLTPTESSTNWVTSGGSQGYRIVGDHCANMVTIHPASNLIKIHRIGITSDRYLRTINVATYNYSSKKVISNY